MALLQVLRFPDPRLRIKAKTIERVDDAIKRTAANLFDTMYENRGVGLAATQVGIHQRMFVMDVSESRDHKICAINPEILHREGEYFEAEGCLSVEGAYDKVKRSAKVHLLALNLDGESFELNAEGLMAVCIQHEIDHLNGILFIDHLSRLKQTRIRKKIEKLQHR